MPQTRLPDTFLRLDASSYHRPQFFQDEKNLAQSLGMKYQLIHFSKMDSLKKQEELQHLTNTAQSFCLVTNTHTPIVKLPKDLLEKTHILLHPNSGYDNFPMDWVQKQKFPIVLGNEIRSQAVAHYTINELLQHENRIPSQKSWDKSRNWGRTLLDEKEILLIGMGTIGHLIQQVLTPLTSRLSLFDPFKGHGKFSDFSSLLKKADIILFACSLNESSQHLLSEENIDLLKEDVLIINGARGPLISESSLIDFLTDHPKAYAVLDVFEEEPFQNQFEKLNNIKTTSHIAGVSKNLDQRILNFEKKYLELLLEDRELPKDLLLQNRIISHATNTNKEKRILL